MNKFPIYTSQIFPGEFYLSRGVLVDKLKEFYVGGYGDTAVAGNLYTDLTRDQLYTDENFGKLRTYSVRGGYKDGIRLVYMYTDPNEACKQCLKLGEEQYNPNMLDTHWYPVAESSDGRFYANLQKMSDGRLVLYRNVNPNEAGIRTKGKPLFPDASWKDACAGPAIVSISKEFPKYGFVTGKMVDFSQSTKEAIIEKLVQQDNCSTMIRGSSLAEIKVNPARGGTYWALVTNDVYYGKQSLHYAAVLDGSLNEYPCISDDIRAMDGCTFIPVSAYLDDYIESRLGAELVKKIREFDSGWFSAPVSKAARRQYSSMWTSLQTLEPLLDSVEDPEYDVLLPLLEDLVDDGIVNPTALVGQPIAEVYYDHRLASYTDPDRISRILDVLAEVNAASEEKLKSLVRAGKLAISHM